MWPEDCTPTTLNTLRLRRWKDSREADDYILDYPPASCRSSHQIRVIWRPYDDGSSRPGIPEAVDVVIVNSLGIIIQGHNTTRALHEDN